MQFFQNLNFIQIISAKKKRINTIKLVKFFLKILQKSQQKFFQFLSRKIIKNVF